ncbi:hypothetical protein C8R41DRAFT_917162 [Lentinula lateritia]|uniref:Uncharacterized protein n=1 Tax=Lentinula lateritia TaxID=40482 RepID=A0ABQ8VN17_9AGAR|nr:hypothetical protein C8R41DRAFT_917162 [Lentinula lateritia]
MSNVYIFRVQNRQESPSNATENKLFPIIPASHHSSEFSLGDIREAQCSELGPDLRCPSIITHVLSVYAEPIPTKHPVRIPVADADLADLLIDLPSVVTFIEDALRDEGIVLRKGNLEARLSSQLTTLIYFIVLMHTQRGACRPEEIIQKFNNFQSFSHSGQYNEQKMLFRN